MLYVGKGSWTCIENTFTSTIDYDSFFCLRLLPSDLEADNNDPRFKKGTVTAHTFLSTSLN